jgi:hypothetical protein
MNPKVLITAILVAAVAQGHGLAGGGLTSGGSPGALLATDYATTAALNLYVDSTGSDSNACTASGSSACLTIQGAVNKVPKLIRHPVLITVGAGSFAGAYVDGHKIDNGYANNPSAGAYLEIQGTLQTATPATGTATGTATGGSAGSTSTFGTLVHGGQTWTVNDLRGKLVTVGSTTRVIQSNTADTITVVGTWTNPNGSAYTIKDWSTVINTAVDLPKTSSTGSSNSAQSAAFIVGGDAGSSAITLRWMKLTTARMLRVFTQREVHLVESRLEPSGTANIIRLSSGSLRFQALRNYYALPASGAVYVVEIADSILSTNNLYRGVGSGNVLGAGLIRQASFTSDAIENLQHGVRLGNGILDVRSSRFDTLTGECVGSNGSNFVFSTQPQQLQATVISNNFASCGYILRMSNGVAGSSGNTGSGNTIGYALNDGSRVRISATDAWTTTGNEIEIDGVATTLANVRAAGGKRITDAATLSTISEP